MGNTVNPALASLARRIVIAELKARGATDPESVEALVSPRLRIDDNGDFIAVGHGGSVLPGIRLSNVLDDVEKSNPALFGKTAGKPSNDPSNPFAPGAGHSVTRQMLLWRSDPERAEYLAAEAGLSIKPIR